ncbi:M20/M25/M40 family metallo-hydrolase [Haliangium ochraceum]|uniref:Peptidase M28 n=1 Tax=Haliangium ochraceum (strain DSM 14365 / JCM 11303 / SMP-2) TaxID=502025 RepID=D0LVG5_HALO1|nr:M20/M25/M40 family metallo-hydrolase [Haliangium ochraceum]ACY17526.1 peptidase M28 [Haliangium ochraceum DSM 14365]
MRHVHLERRPAASILPVLGLLLGACASAPAGDPQEPAAPADQAQAPAQPNPALRDAREVHIADIVQLTDGGENAEAYWSFDGDELIFQSKRPPYECDQIMRMPADGSAEPRVVSTGKGRTTCAYFLPGDDDIVYSSTHELGPECPPEADMSQGYVWSLYDYDIYRAKADGSELVNLTQRDGYDAEATVCAKDGTILFTSDRDGDLELYRMDPNGENVVRLTNTPGYDGGAFFSQDCSQIVWRASRPQGEALADFQRLLGEGLVRPSLLEIYVADADGQNARQITYLGAAAFAPYFHPSGKRVLFSTNYPNPRGREFDIWSVNTDGTGLEQITFSEGFDGFPMFSPDGTKLAFASNRNNSKPGETNVFVARWVEDAAPVENARQPGAADRFRADVAWLADDAREGRGIGTGGLDAAADWLVEQLSEIGAEGAADDEGGYRQGFEVTTAITPGAATALRIDRKPVPAEAFVPLSQSAPGRVRGQTVFVGYGIVADELGVDDYKGKNVRGKIAVVRRFAPAGAPFDDEAVQRRYSDLAYKAFIARQKGARGLIIVDAPPAAQDGAELPPDAPLPLLAPTGSGDAGIPIVVLTRAAGAALTSGRHQVELSVALEAEKRRVDNIVAKIPAGNPDGGGAVLVGAHYDHLGMGGAGSLEVGATVVHNGADDNASGTAGLLEVARQLHARRAELRRDVYLVAFTAEESGIIGSRYFTEHPPAGLRMDGLTAMLNMDMIGRMRGNRVSVMGVQTAAEWEATVAPLCAAARVDCTLGGDGYGPSDHMPFYTSGVPVLFFFTGAHPDYHRASDDIAHINAGGGARIAQLVGEVAVAAATGPAKLSYQRAPVPERQGDVRAQGGSLGTVPAYGEEGKIPGVLLSDVRPEGPAARAGLRAGDRIVAIGEVDVRNIRDLMFVLRAAVPGQKATIVVSRDGERVSLEAIYGAPSPRISR